jgi:hypothetical protein
MFSKVPKSNKAAQNTEQAPGQHLITSECRNQYFF